MKIQKKMEALPAKPHYSETKPLFSTKEIIIRGERRAMVFKISSKLQVLFLLILAGVCIWSGYSSHMYRRSGSIISKKEQQLDQTRVAYENLMTEFAALNKSMESLMKGLEKAEGSKQGAYKKQAEMIEARIAKITKEHEWLSPDAVTERASLYEAQLQRDIVASERDELKQQLSEMEDRVKEMRNIQLDVLNKVKTVSSKEVEKMKKALNEVNKALKEKGLYFNSLSNKRRDAGGPYIPDNKTLKNDKEMNKEVYAIFENLEDIDYYAQVINATPIGKPVWSYWVTSKFGTRIDPFKKTKAVHKGIDLASMTGNNIRTQAAGRVTRAEFVKGYGLMVEIDHGNGFKTKYAHMNSMNVQKGDTVEKGDVVGEVGSTGRSTGPHLHYEILYRGVPVDPMPFMQAKL